jgi:hypothetical protein
MRRLSRVIGVWLAVTAATGCVLYAQDGGPEADRLVPQTRADRIEMERRRKAAEAEPPTPSPFERALSFIEDKKILERITGGTAGFRARLGGLVTGSGMAAGPEYYRRFFEERVRFRTSILGSTRKFYLMDAGLDASLAHNHAFASLYAVHRNSPHIDYYGAGADSAKTGRSGFLLEDTSFRATAGIKPAEHLRLGLVGEYLMVNVGAGRDDRFISTDRIYSEQTAPGIQHQANFLQGGAFAQYDWRDIPGGPRRGGNYLVEYAAYSDVKLGRYSFDRLRMEGQQYFSFFNQRRVIALRGRIEAADPRGGNRVPFYLQPTLGGSDDLRGFRPFRFYDNSSLLLNGEYRWEVFSGLDMALFVDAGRVYHDWRDIAFDRVRRDYGFGFRFNVRNDLFMRIDTGFSNEGFMIWLKFHNVF